jgi:hypothetical protein
MTTPLSAVDSVPVYRPRNPWGNGHQRDLHRPSKEEAPPRRRPNVRPSGLRAHPLLPGLAGGASWG